MRTTCHARGSVWAVLVGLMACRHPVEPSRVPGRPPAVARDTELTSGRLHSCAIRCNGQVWCWGAANYLGQADDADQRFPVEVALSGVARSVVAASDRTCAIVGDERSVVCWGMPPRGLPDHRLPRSTGTAPAEVGVKGATELSVGRWDACAILERGGPGGGSSGSGPTAMCWGVAGMGKEVRPGIFEPYRPVAHYNASFWGFCAEEADGRQQLDCTSEVPAFDRLNQSEPAHPITEALALGPFGFCKITAERRVACSGGSGPVRVIEDPRLADIISLHVDGKEFCAVDAQGSVHCWDHLRSSHDAVELRRLPLEHPVRAISLGWNHRCAVTTGGEILCWGSNRYGQLGDGSVEDSETPVPVAFPGQCP